jgi:putative ABC transport system substrate-binding protein
MRRREFITLLGGAAAWPLAARAQQTPPMPMVGLLATAANTLEEKRMNAFRQGLGESGYIEGQNVRIEYRLAEGHYDRLRALATELVEHKVAVIVTPGTPAAVAAKAVTATIPIVFGMADDPMKHGLVESFAKPGGNATGVSYFSTLFGPKRLGLLRDLVPGIKRVAVLVNRNNPVSERITKEIQEAAAVLRIDTHVLDAGSRREIDAAFATIARERLEALVVGNDAVFTTRRMQIALLATRYAVPAIYSVREYAEAGGLMTYGNSMWDIGRQVGAYAGRILKGAKPGTLPVIQPTKFELVINLTAASAIGLDVPPDLLTLADEVIE